jgi:hypothetical protein
MKKNTGMLVGMVLLVALMLNGCAPLVAAYGAYARAPEVEETIGVMPPAVDADEGLTIDELYVILMESLPATGAVVVRGYLADGCTNIVDMSMMIDEDAGRFQVTLGTYRDPDAMCTMALVEVEEVIELPILGLPAGTYTVEVNGIATTFELAIDNVFVE